MDFADLRIAIRQQRIFTTGHAYTELAADGLKAAPIWASILDASAEMIEDYPTDARGPSCLILSFVDGQPIHSVVAYPAARHAVRQGLPTVAVMITVYRPDQRPHEWSADLRTRLQP